MISLAAPLVLAATPATGSNQPGGQGQEFGSSSPIALVVIILLLVATALLIFSMSKHIKKLPKSFDEEPDPTSPDADDEATADDEAATPDEPVSSEHKAEPKA